MIFSSMALVNNPRGWFFIGLSVAAIVAADLIRAARAELLLKSIHYKPRFSMMFYSVMVCYIANLALPRLGEILRCTFLQRYENIPFQKSLGTVILERAVDVVCWLALLIVALLLNNGVVVKGANQENIAYPSGLCAERTAMFWAGANYPDVPFDTLAVAGSDNGALCDSPASPCGACRQVMAEYEKKHGQPLKIILVGDKLIRKFPCVEALLPFIFDSLDM